MSLQSVTEVCRLCPTTTNLVHVFDKRIVNDNMRDVVYISTGVEIHEKDIISQKVCAKCCNIALRMFKFRQDAAKHDKLLKEKCSELLKEKEIKIPNTSITIKREVKVEDSSRKRPPSPLPKKTENKVITKRKKENPIHHSVASLFGLYPNLKLPTKSLKSDILPVVSLKMGEVENYFKCRKLDMKKFISNPRTRVAKKKTTTIDKVIKTSAEKTSSSQIHEKKRKLSDSEESTKSQKCRQSELAENRKLKQSEPKKSQGTLKLKLSSTSKNTAPHNLGQLEPTLKQTCATKGESTANVEGLTSKLNNESTKNMEGLASKPNNASLDSSSTLSLVDKSIPLLTCNICSAIEYSTKDLKRHLNKHLICQFCKTKFKTLDLKTEHIDKYCIVKSIMNNPGPKVHLEKVDLVLDIRKKHYKTFKNYPKLPNMQDEVESSDNDDVVVCADSSNTIDVIELLSDDEDLSTPVVADRTDDQTPKSSVDLAPIEENITYTTVSIVKPDIKIKGNNLLNRVDHSDTDVRVAKELLEFVRQPKPAVTEKMVQSEMPINKDIKLNSDMTCEFKNLKEHLCVYKVPVVIRNGVFNVTYNYHTESKPSKHLNNWDHLPLVNNIKLLSGYPVNSIIAGPRQHIPNSVSTASTSGNPLSFKAVPINNPVTGTYIINKPSTVIANNIPAPSIVTTNVNNTSVFYNSPQISNNPAGYYSTTHSNIVPLQQNTVFKTPNSLSFGSGIVSSNNVGNAVPHSSKPPVYNSVVPARTMSTSNIQSTTSVPAAYSAAIGVEPSSSSDSNVINTVNNVTTDVRTISVVRTSEQQASLNSQTENTVTNAANLTPAVSPSITPISTTNIRVKSVKELQ